MAKWLVEDDHREALALGLRVPGCSGNALLAFLGQKRHVFGLVRELCLCLRRGYVRRRGMRVDTNASSLKKRVASGCLGHGAELRGALRASVVYPRWLRRPLADATGRATRADQMKPQPQLQLLCGRNPANEKSMRCRKRSVQRLCVRFWVKKCTWFVSPDSRLRWPRSPLQHR